MIEISFIETLTSQHDISRVVWVFGPAVKDGIQDITPTRLTKVALSKLREADHIAQKILRDSGYHRAISQVCVKEPLLVSCVARFI